MGPDKTPLPGIRITSCRRRIRNRRQKQQEWRLWSSLPSGPTDKTRTRMELCFAQLCRAITFPHLWGSVCDSHEVLGVLQKLRAPTKQQLESPGREQSVGKQAHVTIQCGHARLSRVYRTISWVQHLHSKKHRTSVNYGRTITAMTNERQFQAAAGALSPCPGRPMGVDC